MEQRKCDLIPQLPVGLKKKNTDGGARKEKIMEERERKRKEKKRK
jgi:hypothetical protein